MRAAFLVNDVLTEVDEYTTTRLVRAALTRGHEVWYLGVGDVEMPPDGRVVGLARRATLHEGDTLSALLGRVQNSEAQRVVLDDLDALFLRHESVEDLHHRPWASPLGVVVGQALQARGVQVVNDPVSLVRATSKLYLEEFPEHVRPRSLVTRDADTIRRFVAETGHCVLKPLYGSRGHNVFMVHGEDEANLAQMTEAVLQEGYAVVQEFVPGGEEGDVRILVLEGRVLECDGQAAAVRRVADEKDPRANISAGGHPRPVELSAAERGVVEDMADKLVADGMFFVGLDVIGDKVIEINAESPGGTQSIERLYGIDACGAVVDALCRRVERGR